MKKQNGFTLVELMAVLVIASILMALVIPNSLKLASKVKNNAYDTKIELIEKAAVSYGQRNLSYIKLGTDFNNSTRHYICNFIFNEDKIEEIKYNYQSSGYIDKELEENNYWCSRINIEDLVNSNDLSWDETGVCKGNCKTEEEKKAYDNIIVNSKTNYIINRCYVYIYYKNNRVYAMFDEPTCKIQSNVITDGHEYKPLNIKEE